MSGTMSSSCVLNMRCPDDLDGRLNRPLIIGSVLSSPCQGEPSDLAREPLKRFKVHTAGQSIMVMPIKAQKQVIGLLVVMRKQAQPFTKSNQFLLEAIADYAAISLVNVSLYERERANQMQKKAERALKGDDEFNR